MRRSRHAASRAFGSSRVLGRLPVAKMNWKRFRRPTAPPPGLLCRMRKISGQTVYVLAVLAGSCALVAYVFLFEASDPALTQVRGSSRTLEQIPFDGTAAYK